MYLNSLKLSFFKLRLAQTQRGKDGMRLQRSFRDTLRTLFLHVNFVFPYLSKNVFKKLNILLVNGPWLIQVYLNRPKAIKDFAFVVLLSFKLIALDESQM